MNFKKIYTIVVSLFLVSTVYSITPSIKIALDSNYIEMGRQTSLHIEVTNSESEGIVVVPFDSVPPQIEFVDVRNLPKLEKQTTNGKSLYTTTYKIQSFDSGAYRIPPLMYVTANDTSYSNIVALKVIPVDVSQMQDINPANPAEDMGSKWYDWIPDWLTDYWLYYLLAIIIIAGGICAYLILSKKVTVNILPKKKEIPPYEMAIAKLQQLKQEQLWENGQEKAFYTELTDILREYLDRRFGINAMEMTTTQILNAIRNNEETAMTERLMKSILEVADFVKFARVQPLREDNIKSFDAARQFVEDTKPVPVEEDQDENIKN